MLFSFMAAKITIIFKQRISFLKTCEKIKIVIRFFCGKKLFLKKDCFCCNILSGTTQNDLVKWGADGYTVEDAGVAIETSFDGTSDAKIPTSKSIKTNVADNAVLTGFQAVVTPSAIQNVAASDTITDAMEKLDNNTRFNETNISSIQQTIGDINTVLEGVL